MARWLWGGIGLWLAEHGGLINRASLVEEALFAETMAPASWPGHNGFIIRTSLEERKFYSPTL
jgi:hypothetical protein